MLRDHFADYGLVSRTGNVPTRSMPALSGKSSNNVSIIDVTVRNDCELSTIRGSWSAGSLYARLQKHEWGDDAETGYRNEDGRREIQLNRDYSKLIAASWNQYSLGSRAFLLRAIIDSAYVLRVNVVDFVRRVLYKLTKPLWICTGWFRRDGRRIWGNILLRKKDE